MYVPFPIVLVCSHGVNVLIDRDKVLMRYC